MVRELITSQISAGFFTAGATVLLTTSLAVGQSEFKDYTQDIDGTTLSFQMESIPGGTFKMGSPAGESGREEDEGPQHQVEISPFWMSTYEVTWDIFETFVYKDQEARQSSGPVPSEVDAVTRPTKPYLDMTFGMGKVEHPAVGMTQYGAIQFCKWLYVRTGIFYRLPTEAEWEYACRAGTTTAYNFGDTPSELQEYAWFADNSDNETHPVGKKKPNTWGLYDMHGNVAEWTIDQYIPDFYATSKRKKVKDPVAEPEDLYPLVVRGGSFADPAAELRSAKRLASDPIWKQIDPQIPKSNWWFPEAPFLGLRLVRPLTPPAKEEIDNYYNQEAIQDF